MAGRRFPGNEEAIVVRFGTGSVPGSAQLPQGEGFSVLRLESPNQGAGEVWIALSRQAGGNADLFLTMVVDVIQTLRRIEQQGDAVVLRAFLSRIGAWQAFMRGGKSALLSTEAEIGLYGELEVLQALIDSGTSARAALERWKGPLDGLHDFVCEPGALEVKSSVASGIVRVNIGSLEQLDNSLIQPLFLAIVRLALAPDGTTLSEKIADLEARFATDATLATMFGDLVIRAGFIDAARERYSRRFSLSGIQTFLVTEAFPRLTRDTVSPAIRSARYEMDLDTSRLPMTDFADVIFQLGLKEQWN
jgi:hypothetical protein